MQPCYSKRHYTDSGADHAAQMLSIHPFLDQEARIYTSYARQSDIESFLERHSLVVDTTLEDLGVSAFRGKNATQRSAWLFH